MKSHQNEVAGLESKIYLIRGERVMLDQDLALIYQVPTKRLNEQVTRNIERFPEDFMFSLTYQEVANLKSQIATSSLNWGGRRKLPRAFTEHGIAMLSSVLSSPVAIQANIAIVRAFVQMRKVLISNKEIEIKLAELEAKYNHHNQQFKVVFDAIRRIMTEANVPRKRIAGLRNENS